MQYVTIHHLDMMDDLHDELRYGEREHPSRDEFEEHYEPAETILGTSDPDEAYHRAQGHIVNQRQNARHMVRSSMATDVYEIHDGEEVRYLLVAPVGFVEIEWDDAEAEVVA